MRLFFILCLLREGQLAGQQHATANIISSAIDLLTCGGCGGGCGYRRCGYDELDWAYVDDDQHGICEAYGPLHSAVPSWMVGDEILVPIANAKTLFMNSGAEAVENAVKIARAYTGRSAVIAFNGAFHGRSLLTMGLTGKILPYKGKLGPFPGDI